MIIETGNLNARIVSATDLERRWVREYLAFKEGDKDRSPRYQKKIQVLNILTDTFPAGFLPLVQKASLINGVPKIEVLDRRAPPCVADPSADLSWLRDYQLEAADRVEQRVRGILWHPTGSGKTEIAVALALRFPCRWLFVVNANYLVDQAAERWELRTNQPAGRIGEGVWSEEMFTCATFQTLYTRMKDNDVDALSLLGRAQGLIVDEAHVLPADSFWAVAMKTRSAYWRVAMSGTPLARGDRKSLLTIGATGPVIHRIRPEVLIKAGVLSRPKIRLMTVRHNSTANTWHGVYTQCIVESQKRNTAVLATVKRAKKPCIVFVKEIEHGRAIEKLLLRAGYQTEFVFGNDSTDERKSAVRRLVRGDYQVLVASVIFNTGVDIPELRSVVVASGGKSVIAALQRVGRGMRTQSDAAGNIVKNEFEVYDFADEGDKWLKRHTRARLNAYLSEGYETISVAESEQLLL